MGRKKKSLNSDLGLNLRVGGTKKKFLKFKPRSEFKGSWNGKKNPQLVVSFSQVVQNQMQNIQKNKMGHTTTALTFGHSLGLSQVLCQMIRVNP